MKWVIDENSRCDIAFCSGINCSGQQTLIRIFPSGRKGELDHAFRSMKFAANPGLRIILCTSADDENWMNEPWRVIRLKKGIGAKAAGGLMMARIHDLDLYNEPGDLRLAPGTEFGFVEVAHPDEGKGWTFGKGSGSLKGNIRMIRIEKEQ